MFASLRALLSGLIDYAGLFPPARLPLGQALRNYADYRRGRDAWMLGRFVLPAARLAELDAFAEELFSHGPPIAFSVLGRGGATPAEFLAGLESDVRDVATFRARHGERATVDVLETRPPAGINLPEVARQAQEAGLMLFCEGPRELIEPLAYARRASLNVGFKLRCGGVEAAAFPTSRQVADVLRACLDAGLPLKATAGLHHALPRFDLDLGARMHGFVNLFLAGVLAREYRLTAEELIPILDDQAAHDWDGWHFTFDDAGAAWRSLWVATGEIIAARRDFVLSFGSCSFEEPRDDLRDLHWVDAV